MASPMSRRRRCSIIASRASLTASERDSASPLSDNLIQLGDEVIVHSRN